MQDRASELPRIPLPRTSVNKAKRRAGAATPRPLLGCSFGSGRNPTVRLRESVYGGLPEPTASLPGPPMKVPSRRLKETKSLPSPP
jgi:hypothetical protein